MNEIVLSNKKNGMAGLLITILMYLLAIAACIFGSFIIDSPLGIILLVISIIWLCIGWIPVMGLKVLKPQEALVLTLFGKYIGTLKNEGFYYVNPFCVSVNPAAKTKLNQSGDVDGGAKNTIVYPSVTTAANIETINKKISLKIMTLNNNRQKLMTVWATLWRSALQ